MYCDMICDSQFVSGVGGEGGRKNKNPSCRGKKPAKTSLDFLE